MWKRKAIRGYDEQRVPSAELSVERGRLSDIFMIALLHGGDPMITWFTFVIFYQ